MLLPDAHDARVALGMVARAYAGCGGYDELQQAIVDGVARSLYRIDPAVVTPATDDEVAAASPELRQQAVHLMVVLEYVEHPLRPEVATAVASTARALGVSSGLVDDARDLADQNFGALYFDLQRHGWYEHETLHESLHGRFRELVRSKLAYEGVVPDLRIRRRWRALRDCAPGTWGRAVADFYAAHHFPFPGERGGIYELGARHDWVHVLAGYGTSADGEIDVFSFIAASMRDERGLVLLAFTLGLFQNGSIHHVAGKRIKIARAETLQEPGGVDRMTLALARGAACTTDVMGTVDLFAHKDVPLEAVRTTFGVPPLPPSLAAD